MELVQGTSRNWASWTGGIGKELVVGIQSAMLLVLWWDHLLLA